MRQQRTKIPDLTEMTKKNQYSCIHYDKDSGKEKNEIRVRINQECWKV